MAIENPHPSTATFLRDLELLAHRKLNFPRELGMLIDLARNQAMVQPLEDAIFHAKFVTKTQEVMKRIGPLGEGFDKLSTEFQSSMEKTTTLLKTIVKDSPNESKQVFVEMFFSMDQQSFSNLMSLLGDLSWVKNWQVDGRPLPFSMNPSTTVAVPDAEKQTGSLKSIFSSALVASCLMFLFIIVDPPASTLGWILALLILGSTVYIAISIRKLDRS